VTLSDLATLVGIWRSSRCSRPAVIKNGINWTRGETCDGDNHRGGCAVQLALDDVIAAHNALGAPGMR
jgi:hypothetical protein